MKKKLWAVLVAFVALTVFATSAFAAVRWRNVASIYPGISAGDNSYTCEISCLSYKLVTTATVTRNGSSETVSNTFEKKC